MMITKELSRIQKALRAPKGQTNQFGGYRYRSCEDILEAVKPLLGDCAIVLEDNVVEVGGRVYIKATASLHLGDECITSTAFAREADSKKGMDPAQVSGATGSYSRKYALNGLLACDDQKDPDTMKPDAGKTPRQKKNSDAKALDEIKRITSSYPNHDWVSIRQEAGLKAGDYPAILKLFQGVLEQ